MLPAFLIFVDRATRLAPLISCDFTILRIPVQMAKFLLATPNFPLNPRPFFLQIPLYRATLSLEALNYKQTKSVALVRERIIPTERPPPVGEVSANFCG
jgi:hypothetical protein